MPTGIRERPLHPRRARSPKLPVTGTSPMAAWKSRTKLRDFVSVWLDQFPKEGSVLNNRRWGRYARFYGFQAATDASVPGLKPVVTALNRLRSLLSVRALGQSNACSEMRTHHRTHPRLTRRLGSNKGV
jgi:hypothetical protein